MNPDKDVNVLIDTYGIDGLTEYILKAIEARKNANIIADKKDEATKLNRIEQIYRDALRRIQITKYGK